MPRWHHRDFQSTYGVRMMDEDVVSFTDIKFSGGRYNEPGLPVSSVPELERYERIVVEVAKAMWKDSHAGRKRLPGAFSEQLGLRLREVRGGSVTPVLERPRSSLGSVVDQVDDVFDAARDKVDEEFAKIVEGKWDAVDLPPRAHQVLRRFGASLQGDEAFVFRATAGGAVRYDQATRRRYLSQHSGDNVEVEGVLIGIIRGLDADNSFRLDRFGTVGAVPGCFVDESLFDELRAALSNQTTMYHRLTCVYLVNAAGDVVSIQDVSEIELFLSVEDAGGARLIELAQLNDGWARGAARIDLTVLEVVRDLLDALRSGDLEGPRIYPTEGGGIQLEWHGPDRHTEVEVFPDMTVECFHMGPDGQKHLDTRGMTEIVGFLQGVAL